MTPAEDYGSGMAPGGIAERRSFGAARMQQLQEMAPVRPFDAPRIGYVDGLIVRRDGYHHDAVGRHLGGVMIGLVLRDCAGPKIANIGAQR